jgi:hypothetical protein
VDGKVNLADKLRLFQDHWAPRIVADLNDYKISVVNEARGLSARERLQGPGRVRLACPPRHRRALPGAGRQPGHPLRDGTVTLGPGELYVVPRGVEHCPRAAAECHMLLVEPAGTPNTGTAGGERTAPERRI